MRIKRWAALQDNKGLELTDKEVERGWHFCPDWDDLLVGPSMPMELSVCRCLIQSHPQRVKRGLLLNWGRRLLKRGYQLLKCPAF